MASGCSNSACLSHAAILLACVTHACQGRAMSGRLIRARGHSIKDLREACLSAKRPPPVSASTRPLSIAPKVRALLVIYSY